MNVDRGDVVAAFEAAVAAADPEAGCRRAIVVTDDTIAIGGAVFARPRRVVIAGLGKAAPAMARGVASAVGEVSGVVVSDHREPLPPGTALHIGGHPIPSPSSREAGEALHELVFRTGDDELIVFVVSGGGSAVAEIPTAGVPLDDVVAANDLLVHSGLPIEAINEVRAVMSDLKGGRLLEASGARRSATLVLSDVVGGGVEHVASGPTLGQGLGSRARDIVEEADIAARLPGSVVNVLERPPLGPRSHPFVVVGSPALAAEAAALELRTRVGAATTLTSAMSGDVEEAVDTVLDAVASGTGVVAAGETTVAVTGPGLGGRNQHAALLAAHRIAGTDTMFGAFGTDGRDGPTDAAGAVVDGGSLDRMRRAGVDPNAALRQFDSHAALQASGDLVLTGPTGTNVTDVWIAARNG